MARKRQVRVIVDGRSVRCPWCEAEPVLIQRPDGAFVCPDCAWVSFDWQASRPRCPQHLRLMERLGRGWVCPEGCVFLPEGGEAARELVEPPEPHEQDDGGYVPLVIGKRRSGRRKGRHKSPEQQKYEAWLRRRRSGAG